MIDITNHSILILLFIFFVLPGFVSLKIWSLFHHIEKKEHQIFLYDCMFFSVLNFCILAPITIPFLINVSIKNHPVWAGIFVLFYCLIAPAVWPCIWQKLRNYEFIYRFIQLPYPTAWDYFVHQKKSCFMLIHLKDDIMIGGYYGLNSYASTYPDEQSVYLEKVYKINPDGTFGDEMPDTFGMVISKEDYKYIEFFYERQE